MNHVSSTSEPRSVPRRASAETPGHRVREHEVLAPQARGCTLHERVITSTEGLAEFDWVI